MSEYSEKIQNFVRHANLCSSQRKPLRLGSGRRLPGDIMTVLGDGGHEVVQQTVLMQE